MESTSDIVTNLIPLKMEYYKLLKDKDLTDVDSQFDQMEDDLEEIKESLQKFLLISRNVNNVSNRSEKPNSGLVSLLDVSLLEFDGSIEKWYYFKNNLIV